MPLRSTLLGISTSAFLLACLLFASACASSASAGQAASAIPVGADAISVFDGRTLSYTYENGKQFTNRFEGDIRVSVVKRGTLREKVTVRSVGDNLYFVAWRDDVLGMVAQVIDLNAMTVRAAVPIGDGVQLWTAQITTFE